MKLSDFLVDELYKLTATDKVFGYIGGMVAHLVDSIYLNKNIEMVNTITEQGAGFAAEGYARINNRPGIALATSGPGATNLVTPIANCYFDSTPVVFITGQVNTYEYRKYDIKQCGFQETNIVDIVKPITKYAKIITNPSEIKYELQKAVKIATSGRKGPVLLDIPMDIQRAEIDITDLPEYTDNDTGHNQNFNFDIEILNKAKKPLVLVGNGINLSNAKDELTKFLDKTQIPVTESLLGVDTVNSNYQYNLGLIGTYGNRHGNFALYSCDVLLILGSRFDIRQTGNNLEFLKNKKIIHIDIDEKEVSCNKINKIGINADVLDFLKYINKQNLDLDIKTWQEKCLNWKNLFNKTNNIQNSILKNIFENLDNNETIITDVGQNQVWSAQSAIIKRAQRMLTSGGHGCMGFALPASIGASIYGNNTIVISGDGGLQMNIQELEILKRRNLPVKIIVMNNKNLGMVRSFQELYFENRCASTVIDYTAPDFAKIADAYGIDAVEINANDFSFDKIKKYMNTNSPALINIILPENSSVEPRLEFGNSIENSSPLLEANELKELLE